MLPIDPLTTLALSIQANPGVYALLLGSGISRAASIPTGWDVTLNLIERLAAVQGEETQENPAAWFKRKYQKEADYSDLLNELYDQGTRQAKLRGYFEPTDQEREEGKKLPTKAHKAIAPLVKGGYVRVVVTPNFDHLIEDAIRAEGVEPAIISTADAVEGAPALPQIKCLIVKVHGDYLDNRIRNTRTELATYDPRMDALLDQIFDSFGLIVCGWSSDYDTALRAAIERMPNRRYATYWSALSQPRGEAEKLISLRSAKFIQVQSADAFFDMLAEKVQAAADASQPHPADAQVLTAMAKRYLPEDRHRIRLHDLLLNEARDTFTRLKEFELATPFASIPFEKQIEQRNAMMDNLLKLLSVCGLHASEAQAPLLRKTVEVIASDMYANQRINPESLLSLYPAMLAIYVTSLSALSAEHDDIVAEMLKSRGVYALDRGRVIPLVAKTNLEEFTRGEYSRRASLSEFFYRHCAPFSQALFEDHTHFENAFDRFEYITTLLTRAEDAHGSIYCGRWMWRAAASTYDSNRRDIRTILASEVKATGDSWPYFRRGLFGSSPESFLAVKDRVDHELEPIIQQWR